MKNIDFIERDIKDGFCIVQPEDGETVDIAERIRACDHELEYVSGMPCNILSCPKCGWWTFANWISKEERQKCNIKFEEVLR